MAHDGSVAPELDVKHRTLTSKAPIPAATMKVKVKTTPYIIGHFN